MINIDKIKQAIELTQKGELDSAEALYLELLETEPYDAKLLSTFGLFYVNKGDYKEASKYLKRAFDIEKTAGTVSALGFAEFEQGNYNNSYKYLELALQYGKSLNIYDKLILSLFKLHAETKDNFYAELAIKYADKMYELYPNAQKALSYKADALTFSGRLREAERFCVDNIKKNPNFGYLWQNLGYLKEVLYQDYKQAYDCYKIALENGCEAEHNIAISCLKQSNFEEAEVYFKKIIEKHPENIANKISLGLCYLKQKKFKEGYELFYNRESINIKNFTNNLWKPYDKIQDNIVVISDQGFGDNIQFVRYLPFFKDKKIQIACREELKELFKNNYPKFEFINFEEINPDIQSFRITDLAFVLGMNFDNIPFSDGYLKCEKLNIQNDKLKIGLCWEAGAVSMRSMLNRSIHIQNFESLFNLDNIQIYSLQYEDSCNGNEIYPNMINLAKDFKDFSDTAKAINSMDIVITVDTATAHLSGALGKKTFLLLPYFNDWRWFNDTTSTPWYKSVKIFKQENPVSWAEPIEKIIQELNALL